MSDFHPQLQVGENSNKISWREKEGSCFQHRAIKKYLCENDYSCTWLQSILYGPRHKPQTQIIFLTEKFKDAV